MGGWGWLRHSDSGIKLPNKSVTNPLSTRGTTTKKKTKEGMKKKGKKVMATRKDLRLSAFLMDVSERSILMATFAHFTDIAQDSLSNKWNDRESKRERKKEKVIYKITEKWLITQAGRGTGQGRERFLYFCDSDCCAGKTLLIGFWAIDRVANVCALIKINCFLKAKMLPGLS